MILQFTFKVNTSNLIVYMNAIFVGLLDYVGFHSDNHIFMS